MTFQTPHQTPSHLHGAKSMPKDPELQKAMAASISHWDRHARGVAGPGEGVQSKDCDLCWLEAARTGKGDNEYVCPVVLAVRKGLGTVELEEQDAERTESRSCNSCAGTPWFEAYQAFALRAIPGGPEKFLSAATKERDWLEMIAKELGLTEEDGE